MGIGADVIDLLKWLKGAQHLPARPRIMEIGAQQLANNVLQAGAEVKELGSLFGVVREFNLSEPQATHIAHGGIEHLPEEAPRARDFWLWLGFDYASIDIDGSADSIPLDLNFDEAPPSERGRYHLVTNFGTTEHIANQLNAFSVIHELTALNGIMVHAVPAQGYFNHGFVNYNPKFFWMLSRSNGYKVLLTDFFASDVTYCLPQNIVNSIHGFRPDGASRVAEYRAADASMVVVMQKVFDIAFVPPIDVPTEMRPPTKSLEERYWTVFQKDAFERVKAEAVVERQACGSPK